MRIAVFDLDGTITRHDSLFPYVLGFLLRRPWELPRLLGVLPALCRFALGCTDHGGLKEALLKATLRGHTRKELDAWTQQFVPKLLRNGVFAQALDAITEHRRRGDYLVLMSASVDVYVPAVAQALGFSEVICTGVRWDGERLDGALTTPNRRGAEKTRCFTELRHRHPQVPIVAYANASSDLEHLQLADEGILVNASARTRELAARSGTLVYRW